MTDQDAPGSVQFINMTVAVVPAGSRQVRGTWRGAPTLLPASSGEFDWDGRPGKGEAPGFDGPSAGAQVVLGMSGFVGPSGDLPSRGARGGAVVDPARPGFRVDVFWEIV